MCLLSPWILNSLNYLIHLYISRCLEQCLAQLVLEWGWVKGLTDKMLFPLHPHSENLFVATFWIQRTNKKGLPALEGDRKTNFQEESWRNIENILLVSEKARLNIKQEPFAANYTIKQLTSQQRKIVLWSASPYWENGGIYSYNYLEIINRGAKCILTNG